MIAKHQVVPYIGEKEMAEVTPSDLMRLYAQLGGEGANKRNGPLSAHTIWHTRTFIEALYTFAIEAEEDFETSPAKRAKPTVARAGRTPRAVDVQEVEQLVAQAREDLFPAVVIPARLGTRRGETVGLRWSDIDYARATLTVRRSVSQTKADGVEVKSTKTRKVRQIPLDDDTLTELRRLLTAQRKQRMLHGPGWQGAENPDDDYICAAADGALMSPDEYSALFRSFADRSGFKDLTLVRPRSQYRSLS
jgi:integrase